jgi:hypothetical protein
MRVATQAEIKARAFELARAVHAFNLQFARPGSNKLIPLENDGYSDADHLSAFRTRQSYARGCSFPPMSSWDWCISPTRRSAMTRSIAPIPAPRRFPQWSGVQGYHRYVV